MCQPCRFEVEDSPQHQFKKATIGAMCAPFGDLEKMHHKQNWEEIAVQYMGNDGGRKI